MPKPILHPTPPPVNCAIPVEVESDEVSTEPSEKGEAEEITEETE